MSDEAKYGTAWLAISADGDWNVVGWKKAENGDSSIGDSADSAIEGLEGDVWRLHKMTFRLPEPPPVVGEDVVVTATERVDRAK